MPPLPHAVRSQAPPVALLRSLGAMAEAAPASFAMRSIRWPHCKSCGDEVDPLAPGTRLSSKKKGTFKCNRCDSVDTRLRKLLGTSEVPYLNDFSKSEVQDFYVNAAAAAGGKQLEVCVKDELKKHVVKRKTKRGREEWLPLGAWVARGWTEDVVRAHPSKEDATKGTVYNVGIEQVFTDDIDEKV